jgi:hypothetical protein
MALHLGRIGVQREQKMRTHSWARTPLLTSETRGYAHESGPIQIPSRVIRCAKALVELTGWEPH